MGRRDDQENKKARWKDGQLEQEKIEKAIGKAFQAVGRDEAPSRLAERVAKELEEQFSESIPGVEDIQDIVERALIDEGYSREAKAYILTARSEPRSGKQKAIWAWLMILSFPSMPWKS